MCVCSVAQSCQILCDPTDCSQPGFSVHSDPPGKTTGEGCHALLQGIFSNQGLNPGLLHRRWILYCLSHSRSPSQPFSCTIVSQTVVFFFTHVYFLLNVNCCCSSSHHIHFQGRMKGKQGCAGTSIPFVRFYQQASQCTLLARSKPWLLAPERIENWGFREILLIETKTVDHWIILAGKPEKETVSVEYIFTMKKNSNENKIYTLKIES